MYTVFGYTCDCIDFIYVFDSFVGAVKVARKLSMDLSVVFMMREHHGTCLYHQPWR